MDAFTNNTAIDQLQKNRHLYLLSGIALVCLGTFAILFSSAATLFSVLYLAGFLLLIGGIETVQAFKMKFWNKFFLHLILAVLYLCAGGFMLLNPMLNAITLTLLLAFFYITSGIMKVIFALANNIPHRGWVIFNGAISTLLGVLIWRQWPSSGLWVIGLFVGIDAIITGWSWIMLTLMLKKEEKATLQPKH